MKIEFAFDTYIVHYVINPWPSDTELVPFKFKRMENTRTGSSYWMYAFVCKDTFGADAVAWGLMSFDKYRTIENQLEEEYQKVIGSKIKNNSLARRIKVLEQKL